MTQREWWGRGTRAAAVPIGVAEISAKHLHTRGAARPRHTGRSQRRRLADLHHHQRATEPRWQYTVIGQVTSGDGRGDQAEGRGRDQEHHREGRARNLDPTCHLTLGHRHRFEIHRVPAIPCLRDHQRGASGGVSAHRALRFSAHSRHGVGVSSTCSSAHATFPPGGPDFVRIPCVRLLVVSALFALSAGCGRWTRQARFCSAEYPGTESEFTAIDLAERRSKSGDP